MATKKSSSSRTRNYATVVYPESAPDNWRELLAELKVPCFISPLHDKDINPNGEPKKPHYHVQYVFDNVKSVEQVQELNERIGGVGVEIINSCRGYARYLCHLDNPEKAQYSTEDVIALYGADYKSVIGLPTDKYKCIREMKEWCRENNNYYYCDLFDYAEECRQDWFICLCDNSSYVIKEWLKSFRFKCECESGVNKDDEIIKFTQRKLSQRNKGDAT